MLLSRLDVAVQLLAVANRGFERGWVSADRLIGLAGPFREFCTPTPQVSEPSLLLTLRWREMDSN